MGPPGYLRTLTAERRPYQTADGYVCAIIYTDNHWRSFGELVGRPRPLEDPHFADFGARTTHADHVRLRCASSWPRGPPLSG